MKTKLIITGFVLMVIGLLLMHFTNNPIFSIIHFIGLFIVGTAIIVSLREKKREN